MSNISAIQKALWQCRIPQSDGSFKVDRELIDLILQLFCVNKKWTLYDNEIMSKIKYYNKFYNGKLMYYKIEDTKRLLNSGVSKEHIAAQLD